ncbi:hypothetical protein PILCRDRAFT_642784 [Piloderma croceum F 1598]|uniref:Uncharacterized protein n=1 Tax=Piloderma croceum (strain F 1598) TaxID=765440 RepID=A0A0C3EVU1_PILCF|nr:hypothetical protein PILCRDRAFT_642784 [Piloderma croceum F 1598]
MNQWRPSNRLTCSSDKLYYTAMTTTKTPCPTPTEIGSGLIGFMVCLSLYGVTLAQTIVYFRRFPVDVKGSKFLVFFLWYVCILPSEAGLSHE